MLSLWPKLATWLDAGEPFALATISRVEGSAPRAPGACMAILPKAQRFLGSVSSGCLETEVIEAAKAALSTGRAQFLRFGPDGVAPWTDGLTCGGCIETRVEPWWGFSSRGEVRAIAPLVRRWLERDQRKNENEYENDGSGEGVILSRGDSHLAMGADGSEAGDVSAFDATMRERARTHLVQGLPPATIDDEAGNGVFIRTVRRAPRLVMIGAVDVAAHLVSLAGHAGWMTTVIDPRAAYAVAERFHVQPDRLVRGWPQKPLGEAVLGPRDSVITLAHDPKIDDAALLAALATDVGYLGALGSSRSHAERRERLAAAGASAAAIDRITGPAGIHLGTPDSAGIATGILAGLLQWQAAAEKERLAIAREPQEAREHRAPVRL